MRNFIVTIDGKSYSVGVEEVGETDSPARPAQATAPKANEAALNTEAKAEKPAKGTKVLSPFPGLIKNILVHDGDKVTKNQPILVLEAMKMDNDITASADGIINFAVAKGANVETNTLLATIS